jgi:hypothetical protein
MELLACDRDATRVVIGVNDDESGVNSAPKVKITEGRFQSIGTSYKGGLRPACASIASRALLLQYRQGRQDPS